VLIGGTRADALEIGPQIGRGIETAPPDVGSAALCGGTHFNEVDGEIGIRGVLVVTNDGQIGSVTATNRTDPARSVAAAALCLVEGFVNKTNSGFQRNLAD
jgi:hypothetical protein